MTDDTRDSRSGASEDETLKDEAQAAEQEARMVLPGIQALFGFQMIAVFSERFTELDPYERWTHLGSLGLVTLAIACAMAPAAYHRMAEPGRVSRRFVELASSFLAWAMVFLAGAIGSELYVVVKAGAGDDWFGTLVAVVACSVFAWFWFALPMRKRRRARLI